MSSLLLYLASAPALMTSYVADGAADANAEPDADAQPESKPDAAADAKGDSSVHQSYGYHSSKGSFTLRETMGYQMYDSLITFNNGLGHPQDKIRSGVQGRRRVGIFS